MDISNDETFMAGGNQDVKVCDLFSIENNFIQVVCKIDSLFN